MRRPLAFLRFRQRRRQLWRRRAWKAWAALKEEFGDEFDLVDLDADEWDDFEFEEGLSDGDFSDADFALLDDIDLTALYTVFSDMKGHEDEFLADGRPRVDAVVARLKNMGLPGKVHRDDIDEAFEQWEKRG